jgi:hypothetical protein
VVVKTCTEVCRIKESLSTSFEIKPQIVFELNNIELIPLMSYNYEGLKKMDDIKDKIKKYLGQGFYFAINFDMTTNA